ncbi:HNH/ENDO VII family nuclease [Nocardia sp. GCM10030253]|uniref:HNH/ENDO VII family nuclease n=1 Tax=Nocardia sp. GCM10030253 TaxID=3273404 RepID=UPI003625AF0C
MTDILAMAWREAAQRLGLALGERTPFVLASLFHTPGAELKFMVSKVERLDTNIAKRIMLTAEEGVNRRVPLGAIGKKVVDLQNTHRAGLAAGKGLRMRLPKTRQALDDLNAPPTTARPDAELEVSSTYSRPTGYRKGVRQTVWDMNKDADGLVRDKLTGQVIDPTKPWHMGHKPGLEFWKHQRDAAVRGITREEFLNEHNDVNRYRPELPSSNLSHAGEDHSDNYLGGDL